MYTYLTSVVMIDLIIPWPFRTLLSSASCSNFTNVMAPRCFAMSNTLSWLHTRFTIRRTKNCWYIFPYKYIILSSLRYTAVQNTKTRGSISLEFEPLPVIKHGMFHRYHNIQSLILQYKGAYRLSVIRLFTYCW